MSYKQRYIQLVQDLKKFVDKEYDTINSGYADYDHNIDILSNLREMLRKEDDFSADVRKYRK